MSNELKVKDTETSKYVYSTKEYVNLSPFEKSFVKHYVNNGGNGAAAAKAAGSKAVRPNQIAFQTLQKPEVNYVISLLESQAQEMAAFTKAELYDKARATYDLAIKMAMENDDPRALKEAVAMIDKFMTLSGFTQTKVNKNINVHTDGRLQAENIDEDSEAIMKKMKEILVIDHETN